MRPCKNLYLIMICEKDLHYARQIRSDGRFLKIFQKEQGSKTLFVMGDRPASRQSGDFLYLNHKEGYNNLSVKTFKAIEYCHNNFKFKKLIKVDCNIFDYHKTMKSRAKKFDPKVIFKKIIKNNLDSEYGGIIPHITNEKRMRAWIDMHTKGGKFMGNETYRLIKEVGEIPYFQGKFYYIKRRFARFISSSKGSRVSRYFVKNLGGAEDVFIGLMYLMYRKKVNSKQIMNIVNAEQVAGKRARR